MVSPPARFAAAMQRFLSQYWLKTVAWDVPENAVGLCTYATKAFLNFFLEEGFQDLYYVEVLGGRHFDPEGGEQLYTRHYHVLARVGNLYIDLTYRQFEGQEESDWPLIVDVAGINELWSKRRDTPYGRDFPENYEPWEELI